MDQVYDISSSSIIDSSDNDSLARCRPNNCELNPHNRMNISSDENGTWSCDKVINFVDANFDIDGVAKLCDTIEKSISETLPVKSSDKSSDEKISESSVKNCDSTQEHCSQPLPARVVHEKTFDIRSSQPTSKSSQLGTPKLKPTKRSVLPDIDEFNFTKRSSTTISRGPETVQSNADQREENLSTDDEIVLSVFWKSGKLGAAYLNLTTRELFTMQDTVDYSPEFRYLQCLYYQVRPMTVLSGFNLPQPFIQTLKTLTFSEPSSNLSSSDVQHTCLLQLLRSRECNLQACTANVMNIELDCCPADLSQPERRAYLEACVPHHSEQAMISLGVLVSYAETHYRQIRAGYSSLKIITLEDQLLVDNDTLQGLKIFHETPHPAKNQFGVRGTAREGLSIFAIFNQCKSTIGSKRMRCLLQQPSRVKEVLEARLDNITWCLNPRNTAIINSLIKCITSIYNISIIMTRIELDKASYTEWRTLYNTMRSAAVICEICNEQAQNEDCPPIIRAISNEMIENPMVHEVTMVLNRTLDLEETINKKVFSVKTGICEQLDERLLYLAGQKSVIDEAARIEVELLPDFITSCNIACLPEIGYFLTIPHIPGISPQLDNLEQYNLQFKFINNNFRYYKSEGCLLLDERFGAVHREILAITAKIKSDLVKYISVRKHIVQKTIMLCAELDCMITMAKVAREFTYVRPEIVSDVCIEIKGGRHPLQELCTNQFTPNDTHCSKTEGLVKIITGPNASGKSVYLKQVALIVYLAHVGSYVPAEFAKIGVFHALHSRIRSIYISARKMSDFQIDLSQMSLAISSPARSLLVIDEFGKGTSVLCGRALLQSSLQDLLNRGENCPITLVTTHLKIDLEDLHNREYLRAETFEHTIASKGMLVFLYRLIPGQTTKSFATTVARSSGIPKSTTDRAKARLRETELPERSLEPSIQDLNLVNGLIFNLLKRDSEEIDFNLDSFKTILKDSSDEEESPTTNPGTSTTTNGGTTSGTTTSGMPYSITESTTT